MAIFEEGASLAQKIYDSFAFEPEQDICDTYSTLSHQAERLDSLIAAGSSDIDDCIDVVNQDFISRSVYNSTVIEGSSLSLEQTELAIDQEFLPSNNKELQDLFAVKGCYEGYCYALEEFAKGRSFDQDFLKDINERTALDIQPANRGIYRIAPVYIRGSITVPAAPESVRPRMNDLMAAYNGSKLPSMLKAVAFHAMFENIHPFRDGNDRTGRTVLNMMLIDAGYPPIAIRYENKTRYFEALEQWQSKGNPSPLLDMAAECIDKELSIRENAVERALSLEGVVREERKQREQSNAHATYSNPVDRIRALDKGGYRFKAPNFGNTPESILETLNDLKKKRQ